MICQREVVLALIWTVVRGRWSGEYYLWVRLDDGQPPRPVWLFGVGPEEVVDLLVCLLLCLRCGGGAVQPDLVLAVAIGLAPGARCCGRGVCHDWRLGVVKVVCGTTKLWQTASRA